MSLIKLARLQARILSGDQPSREELIAVINERTREIAEARQAGQAIRKPAPKAAKPRATAAKSAEREKAKAGLDALLGALK